MTEDQSRLERMMRQLETERDELKLKLNLAKMDARDEWEKLEGKMESLRGRMKVLGGEAKEATGEVGAAAGALAEEIKEGFSRLRKMM